MSILIEHRGFGLAEADHRIANNLASLSGVIRLQRNSISKSGTTFTTEQVCMLLDDIDARIEVTAKLHKSLARADGNRGKFLARNRRDDWHTRSARKDGLNSRSFWRWLHRAASRPSCWTHNGRASYER